MNQIGERDITFDEIKPYLEEDARGLFPLPDYAEVARNLVSMANFLPLLEPLLDEISPKAICEIGAYRGISTRALASIAERNQGRLFVVDPAIDPNKPPVEGEHIRYFQMLSEQFLETPRGIDLCFIDGDHNYEVVSTELSLVAERQNSPTYPILFMHDIGWPCGLRDMYYEPSRVSLVHELGNSSVIEVTTSNRHGFRMALPKDVEFASHSGGERNGVQTAIRDFQSRYPGWKLAELKSLYGLGILWHEESVSPTVSKQLVELDKLFERINPFLSILEFNRVLLLSELNMQGSTWHQDQAYIKEANAKIAELQSLKGALKQVMNRLTGRK